jgi:uncharacterized protein (TIGR02147 family)
MKEQIDVFSFENYKKFLTKALPKSGEHRGQRASLARRLGCQPSFISVVLNGSSHFSMEHAVVIADHLSMNGEETSYFLLLVQMERAGSELYLKHLQREMKRIRSSREKIKERLKARTELNEEARATYYSSWLYAAIHVMTSVPSLQTVEALSSHLQLSPALVKGYLETLEIMGLVVHIGGKYLITSRRIHLGTDSPLLAKHHVNWRLRAMQALDGRGESLLHYSSVISLSTRDALSIREILMKALEQQETILKLSKEEAVYSLSMDFFRL